MKHFLPRTHILAVQDLLVTFMSTLPISMRNKVKHRHSCVIKHRFTDTYLLFLITGQWNDQWGEMCFGNEWQWKSTRRFRGLPTSFFCEARLRLSRNCSIFVRKLSSLIGRPLSLCEALLQQISNNNWFLSQIYLLSLNGGAPCQNFKDAPSVSPPSPSSALLRAQIKSQRVSARP